MYKYLKLTVDILFLIISVMILAYLYLFNAPRPTCIHDRVSPVVPRIAWATQELPLLTPVVATHKTPHRTPLPTETIHG